VWFWQKQYVQGGRKVGRGESVESGGGRKVAGRWGLEGEDSSVKDES
jgi:hypothetical protein